MTEILIIRPQSIQLGDTICSMPMFKAIKDKYPDSFITFIGCPTNYNVNLKKLNPFIDDFVIFKKDNLFNVLSFFKNLRKKKYDIIIVPSTTRISSTSYIIALLSKGITKVGINRIDNVKNKFGFVLDVKENVNWTSLKTNQVFRFLDTIKSLECNISPDDIRKMRINLNNEEIEFGNNYILNNFPDKNKLIFGFHPGGGKIQNIWDVEKYYELIVKTYQTYNPYILITSGFLDSNITDVLESKLTKSDIKFISNKGMDAYNLASVLRLINLYVSNDTGVMHLAAFAGTNTISVFRKGESAEWKPLFNNSECVESESDNINLISADTVFNEIKKMFPL